MVTVASLFANNVESDPARPLLTWYSPQERTELSGATMTNWVQKTANLLVDEGGFGAGDVARLNLPPHWQTSCIMLGCWMAGLAVAHSDSVTPDITFGLPGTACDYVVGLHPFALPVPEPSGGARDWVLSARAHGDHFSGPPTDPGAPALVGLPTPVTHADLAGEALEHAAQLGIGRTDRVLVNVDSHPRPLDWLVAPVAAGASLVLCLGMQPQAVDAAGATERVTVSIV